MNTKANQHVRSSTAFTLIELLAVIAIIAIVATMVAAMSKYATQIKVKTRVTAEISGLATMINNYHAKLNFYPPDNGALATNSNPALYDSLTAANPLFYELTGVTNTNNGGMFFIYNINNSGAVPMVHTVGFNNAFNRGGVANADPTEPQDFYQPGPMPQDCAPIYTNSGDVFYGLVVPAPSVATNRTMTNNFVHYDASSTNRHNMNSFDIWAEYVVGSKPFTNGNW
jgi:prepilin-type N-terminal cleavage/methylation domain-containing protein